MISYDKISENIFNNKSNYSDNYYANLIIKDIAEAGDGVSLEINGKQIRLFNVDAPEWDQKCSNRTGEEYACGSEASKYLRALVKEGEVRCKVLRKDYYKRFLSICTNQAGKNLSIELIKAGWALPYYTNSEYYEYKHIAKKAKKGIWQGEFTLPRIHRKLRAK